MDDYTPVVLFYGFILIVFAIVGIWSVFYFNG